MTSEVKDKHGKPIHEGDIVVTKARGGKRTGEVTEIVTDQREGVKNPPKVLFQDQHGHDVAHNPGALEHGDTPSK
ncbi:hypothetical protein M422DRAFT_153280 [Sphaerobolus stellatus SS14]|nr:hypothetical protein M422DRAFT_153280 [Sphaerobolus stellatus SS14]